jgi:type IV pilus assembly protein PilQ
LDRPVKQVLIESRIVTANDDYSKELGARFGVSATRLTEGGNLFGTSGSSSALDRMNNVALIDRLTGGTGSRASGPSDQVGDPIAAPPLNERLNVNLPTDNQPAGSFGLSILGSNFLVDLELSALESERRGEVISSPRVITANQSEAYIQQGREIPYLEAAASGAATISFKPAVLELRVIPLITPDNRIMLRLNVKQDTQGEDVNVAGGGTQPAVDTREILTQVLVNNGETVVLGGIYEQRVDETKTKVPLLGDLPGIGNVFRSTNRSDQKSELLIFITPRILNDSLGR